MNVERIQAPPSDPSRTGAVDFDDYVTARGRDLVRTAYLLTGDHQGAEDLVQIALSKVWPRWDRIVARADPPPHAYVRRVLLTTYIAWWRRRWTGEHPTEQLPEPPPVRDAGDSAAQHADLIRALATLPRGQRAVIVLRYFEDLTEAQTADALGCSVGAVKTQTSRALAKLRTSSHLTEEGARQ